MLYDLVSKRSKQKWTNKKGAGPHPRTLNINDFTRNVKGVNMKYFLFVIIFVPVFLTARWVIRKLWK